MKPESWKPIPRYFGRYEYSDYFQIRSLNYRNTKRTGMMKISCNNKGYLCCDLWNVDHKERLYIHRLVAEHYFGRCPNGMVVNHLDGDKKNNNPGNLEYCTPSENSKHAYRTGLKTAAPSYGENHGMSKLLAKEVVKIRYLFDSENLSQTELSNMFGVTISAIHLIVRRKNWASV